MRFEEAKNFALKQLRRKLPEQLSYHDVEHTLDVLRAVEIIARGENVSGDDLTLLRTAAVYHDLGFVERYKNNECLACRVASESLPEFGYSPERIETITEMILATQLPQRPETRSQEILCDADLFYLGTDQFQEKGDRLRRELASQGIVFTDADWIDFQIMFLEKHRYFTETCERLQGAGKRGHLEELRKLAKQN